MTPELPAGEGIHHPKFGQVLKEKMDALGVECVVRFREDLPELSPEEVRARFHREQVAFVRRHFEMTPDSTAAREADLDLSRHHRES